MHPTNPYDQLYVKLQFERAGLFRLIKKLLPINTVFYPCCSFHVTPSFFFSTVCYLDRSDVVAGFFRDEQQLTKIIQPRKEVASPNLKFFHSGLEDSLDSVPEVDLVIALFGGDVLRHAFKKARRNGYILSSSDFSGESILRNDRRFNCLFHIACQSGDYRLLKSIPEKISRKKSFTKDNVFRDTLLYSVYQRTE